MLDWQGGTVIGAGGYGRVYRANGDGDRRVIKAIYTARSCHEARDEFQKQRLAYDSLVTRLQACREPAAQMAQQVVRVAEPLVFVDQPVVVAGKQFACAMTMRLLNGLPLQMFLEYNRSYTESRFDPLYLQSLDPGTFELQAHLAFNSDVGGIYGRCYSCGKISTENPPRGFFITPGAIFLDFLRERYGLPWSDEQLRELLGFVYGRLFYDAQLAPVDIELTLGFNQETRQFELNVLDFGMTYDLHAHSQYNVEDIATEPFHLLETQREVVGEEEWQRRAKELVMRTIDTDLYAPMDNPGVQMQFFNAQTLCR
jgi:hypothetical protein